MKKRPVLFYVKFNAPSNELYYNSISLFNIEVIVCVHKPDVRLEAVVLLPQVHIQGTQAK